MNINATVQFACKLSSGQHSQQALVCSDSFWLQRIRWQSETLLPSSWLLHLSHYLFHSEEWGRIQFGWQLEWSHRCSLTSTSGTKLPFWGKQWRCHLYARGMIKGTIHWSNLKQYVLFMFHWYHLQTARKDLVNAVFSRLPNFHASGVRRSWLKSGNKLNRQGTNLPSLKGSILALILRLV